MSDRLIRSSRPYFPKEDIDSILKDIRKVLEEGALRNGRNLLEFERMFADYIGLKNAVAFDSDGDALETALRYFGVEGKEVVVCTNSFVSIPNSVVYAGGRVVFADIRADTLSMNHESLRDSISDKTCGVVVTHIAGFPNPDLNEIIEICNEHGLFLIEDATHAAGAMIDGVKVGTFGEAAVFAFTPTKVLTTGEGGMLVTNDANLTEKARRFRYYGSGTGKTEFVDLGRHMMLPEISAVLGIHQLRRLDEFIAKRNLIARIYDERLSQLDSVSIVRLASGYRSSYYKYPLTLAGNIETTKFAELLKEVYQVETGNVFYPPCHMQATYKRNRSVRERKLPIASEVLVRTITLPIHAAMEPETARLVVL